MEDDLGFIPFWQADRNDYLVCLFVSTSGVVPSLPFLFVYLWAKLKLEP